MKIAIIGAGIAGLSAAWQLSRAGHHAVLYEAGDYFGGHTHTVDVSLNNVTCGIDTGFLVFNERTYPGFIALLDALKVESVPTDMSFSVSAMCKKSVHGGQKLEWAGTSLRSVFAQPRNLCSPRFIGMLRDILRFNRQATRFCLNVPVAGDGAEQTLGDFLDRHRYGKAFRDWYLLPMAGCIWSCPTEQMLRYPLRSFIEFCHNHGLLQIANRPQWRTITGGARHYVRAMLADITEKHLATAVTSVIRPDLQHSHSGSAGVTVESRLGRLQYDAVVMATHSDQTLHLLKDATTAERQALSAVRYQPNQVILHTDARLLPSSRTAWAAWNYESHPADSQSGQALCVHYLINKLQPLPFEQPVIVSLNPVRSPDPASVLGRYEYAHPVFDTAAKLAQQQIAALQGQHRTWFAGAWLGHGFHEDGLQSARHCVAAILDTADKETSDAQNSVRSVGYAA